jgi:hypothetical protein
MAFALMASCVQYPDATGPSVQIAVAPLTLPGVGRVCYDLRVTDGPLKTDPIIWAQGTPGLNGGLGDADAVCSNAFGNGTGGAITFVGACVASPPDFGQTGRTNSVTLWVDGLYDAGANYIAPTGSDGWQDPCPTGCTLSTLCQENADAKVEFNLTILRQANQGFFDIGVNFQDIFCSAKVDCVGDGGQPLKLLFRDGQRDTTVVSAFACTAGPDAAADTVLYRNPLVVSCGGATIPLDPGGTDGNAWTTDPTPGDAVWQYAIYAGDEALNCGGQSCQKQYWNVAIGLDAAVDNCVLTTSMSASDGPMNSFKTPAKTTYPYISVNVPLTDGDGLICGKHKLNVGTEVVTSYTPIATSLEFTSSFDGDNFSDSLSSCAPGVQVLSSTGALQNFVVPEGCGTVHVKLWGAGGGGFCWTGNGGCQAGGGGGFTSGLLATTPGETLSVIVGGAGLGGQNESFKAGGFGGGGSTGGAGYAGSGGGRSAIRRGSIELATAGGGGGAGASYNGVIGGSYGGAGGGLVGENGGNPNNGLGGTQVAGGTGTGGSGSAFQGGSPSNWDNGGGGAGGGGYFGGGAGSSANDGEGGGGGGSGYVGGLLPGGATVGGSRRTPASVSDVDYQTGIAEGGLALSGAAGNGKAGLVVIRWGLPAGLAYPQPTYVVNSDFPVSIPAPTYHGMPITSCSISPALPTGLTLSTTTCAISGSTSIQIPETTFTVTGTNPQGSSSTTLKLRVTDECIAGERTFEATGSLQSFETPPSCTSLSVKLWGAGGGGYCYTGCAPGGAGGFTSGVLSVTPREVLSILVGGAGLGGEHTIFKAGGFGGGGSSGSVGYGGSGGGRSAIRRGSTELVTAGGGGGAGASHGDVASCGAGGAGGGLNGLAGGCVKNGLGGTQTEGGTGAGGNGSAFQGASPGNWDYGGGGAGGGGYFGGGAGTNANDGEGGGGGGSGYIGGLESGSTTAGSGTTPGASTDADRGSAGTGGSAASGAAGNGSPGRIVIRWAP